MNPEDAISMSSHSGASDDAQSNERDQDGSDDITLPAHIAGSGKLDRLVSTARDYARAAASDNTLKAYAKDWPHFARWCRMKGAEPLPLASELIALYPDTIRSENEEPTEDRNPLRTGFEISRCKSPFYDSARL